MEIGHCFLEEIENIMQRLYQSLFSDNIRMRERDTQRQKASLNYLL